jgi:hypothetical protein
MCVVDKKKRPTKQAPWRDLALGHLPLMVTGLLFTFVFARLFVIAHGNLQTARAMLSTSGTVEVVFGTLLSVLPVIGWILVGIGGVLATRPYSTPIRILAIVLALVGVGITALTSDWTFVIVPIMMAITLVAIPFVRPEMTFGLTLLYAFGLLIPMAAITVFADDEPWLPAETIAVEGRSSIVGYVLGTEGDSLVVLTDDERLVQRIDVADIMSRRVCQPEGELRPLIQPWRQDRGYAEC